MPMSLLHRVVFVLHKMIILRVSQLNTQTQPTSHYHSRTTIGGSAPMYGMPPELMAGVSTSAPLYSMPQYPTTVVYAPGNTSNTTTQAPTSASTATTYAPGVTHNTLTYTTTSTPNATAYAPASTCTAPKFTVPSPSPVTYAYGYPSQAYNNDSSGFEHRTQL